jgi:hypothetical protein
MIDKHHFLGDGSLAAVCALGSVHHGCQRVDPLDIAIDETHADNIAQFFGKPGRIPVLVVARAVAHPAALAGQQ